MGAFSLGRLSAVGCLLLAFAACEGQLKDPGSSSGSAADGGSAGDAGRAPDAGVAVDAGRAPDAGVAVDAGRAPDAGGEEDAGAASDAGSCAPATCASLHKNCDSIGDGCGHSLSCGTCTSPQTCGGGGVANVCGSSNDLGSALKGLAKKRVFFGHHSVGAEILGLWAAFTASPDGAEWGIEKILADHAGSGVSVVDDSALNLALSAGQIANASPGDNGDPLSKLQGFDQAIRGGVGSQVDVAFFKFCFVDFPIPSSPTFTLAQYKATLDALQTDYPNVRFIHVTAPLSEAQAAWHNDDRDAWNQALRAAYPAADIFDLADFESLGPSGARETAVATDEAQHPCLASAWAAGDGGHLNQAGADMLAQKLVLYLGNLP